LVIKIISAATKVVYVQRLVYKLVLWNPRIAEIFIYFPFFYMSVPITASFLSSFLKESSLRHPSWTRERRVDSAWHKNKSLWTTPSLIALLINASLRIINRQIRWPFILNYRMYCSFARIMRPNDFQIHSECAISVRILYQTSFIQKIQVYSRTRLTELPSRPRRFTLKRFSDKYATCKNTDLRVR